jgi:hypothetical protein
VYPIWYYDSGLEYRYWVQYDPRLMPREIAVPELEGGRDFNYSPPEGYVMKKRGGSIVFFIDEQDPTL